MRDIILFDADDTLWHNENLFTATHEKFRDLLTAYHDAEWIDQRLYATEMRNLHLFGYGIKGFVLSMIETAVELTEARITGREVQQLIDLGKEMLQAPVEPLPHVRKTLETLDHHFTLMVVTKGDLFDQESKLARSGLGDFFDKVEVVSEKDTDTYRRILQTHQLDPARLVMVGNSLKSDILPVLPLGILGVHIPYHTTWVHEQVAEGALTDQTYHTLEHVGALPAFLQGLSEG